MSCYLWTSGGQLSLSKFLFYLIFFIWMGTIFWCVTKEESPGTISIKQSFLNPNIILNPQMLTWLDMTDVQHTLWVYIAPDGSGVKQLKILKEKMISWCKCLWKKEGIKNQDRLVSYQALICPALVCLFITHNFIAKDLCSMEYLYCTKVLCQQRQMNSITVPHLI